MAEFTPQIGPQKAFLESLADIAIFGGAAGGGKSHAILLEATRFTGVKGFGAVIFRRTLADVKKQGSLWDSSIPLYGTLGAVPRLDTLSWTFPGKTKITFSHLEHEKNVLDWQGAQIPLIVFDELTHFSKAQFFYMLSRNRSTCGVRPYIRATCNPDADSWVASFIAWWIDQATGFAIPERSGVLRWFIRVGDEIRWADSKEELEIAYPGCEPKSVTFIGSKLEDNKILMDADPGYRANLLALDKVERERLLNGNWKIRPAAGLYFQRYWCELVDTIPLGTKFVRGWDLAATPKTEMNDPDWTTGTKLGVCPDGRYIIADHIYFQGGPAAVESTILKTAISDGKEVRIHIPQDPAAAGKAQVEVYRKLLAGFNVRFAVASGDKVTRFSGFSAQADPGPSANAGGKGKVIVLRAPWNERFFSQLEAFPPEGSGHDDDADSTSEAFNGLVGKFGPGEALLEMTRQITKQAAAEAAKKAEPILMTYAPGSVEYEMIMAAEAAELAAAA
jgi:predicted phage terminase large subunit-like protein